jgi:hypothetical protein
LKRKHSVRIKHMCEASIIRSGPRLRLKKEKGRDRKVTPLIYYDAVKPEQTVPGRCY